MNKLCRSRWPIFWKNKKCFRLKIICFLPQKKRQKLRHTPGIYLPYHVFFSSLYAEKQNRWTNRKGKCGTNLRKVWKLPLTIDRLVNKINGAFNQHSDFHQPQKRTEWNWQVSLGRVVWRGQVGYSTCLLTVASRRHSFSFFLTFFFLKKASVICCG